MEQSKETWAEAVITCVSDKAERERLIRMYDYDELVQACLTLGGLALTAKVEAARNSELESRLKTFERLHLAALPFVQLLDSTSGRIPSERLSLAQWHELVKAHTDCIPPLGVPAQQDFEGRE